MGRESLVDRHGECKPRRGRDRPSYAAHMRDVGIASAREPDVRRDEGVRIINLTFRGTSDARSSVDRDTRIRIALPPAQAARLWQLLGEHLSDQEKQFPLPADS